MCIEHKGFRGFRAASPASNMGGKLIGLKPAIPYDTIHLTLGAILSKHRELVSILIIFKNRLIEFFLQSVKFYI